MWAVHPYQSWSCDLYIHLWSQELQIGHSQLYRLYVPNSCNRKNLNKIFFALISIVVICLHDSIILVLNTVFAFQTVVVSLQVHRSQSPPNQLRLSPTRKLSPTKSPGSGTPQAAFTNVLSELKSRRSSTESGYSNKVSSLLTVEKQSYLILCILKT